MGENPMGRIGKGFRATSIGPELVAPKCSLKMVTTKGKQVNIPVPRSKPATIDYDQTFVDKFSWAVAQAKCIPPWSSVVLRSGTSHEWPANRSR